MKVRPSVHEQLGIQLFFSISADSSEAVSRKHPTACRYPGGVFLQSSVIVWSARGERGYEWFLTKCSNS